MMIYVASLFIFDDSLFVNCSRDCGFFMLQIAQSWNGEAHTDFTYRDIPNMKKLMLWKWAKSEQFNVFLQGLFGYSPGI